jgi:hypothetical protein
VLLLDRGRLKGIYAGSSLHEEQLALLAQPDTRE